MQTSACFFSAAWIASCSSSATLMEKTHPSQHLHEGCLLTIVLREQDNDREAQPTLYHLFPFLPPKGMPTTKATGLQSMMLTTISSRALAAIQPYSPPMKNATQTCKSPGTTVSYHRQGPSKSLRWPICPFHNFQTQKHFIFPLFLLRILHKKISLLRGTIYFRSLFHGYGLSHIGSKPKFN